MRAKATHTVRAARIVAVIVLAAMGLMASGGGGNPPSTGQSQPKYGGTLVVASSSDPGLLNPAITSSGVDAPGHRRDLQRPGAAVQQGLPPGARPRQQLGRLLGGLTYTFRLQQGVTWHDG